jgi:hypothetical protein
MTLTADHLRAFLHYDPDTGIFTRRVKWGRRNVGDKPGSISKYGYLQIGVGGRTYTAQRLAWLYVHGEWPVGVIDHINRDKLDNRLCNLRSINHSRNAHNRPAKTEHRGVYYKPIRKGRPNLKPWEADASVDGLRVWLGRFATKEEAILARKKFCDSFGL